MDEDKYITIVEVKVIFGVEVARAYQILSKHKVKRYKRGLRGRKEALFLEREIENVNNIERNTVVVKVKPNH